MKQREDMARNGMADVFMKKAAVIIILLIFMLTGCYPAYIRDMENHDTGGTTGNVESVETKIDRLDEKSDHITIELKKNLLIDADVTEYDKYGGKKFGIYPFEYIQEIENRGFYGFAEEKYGADNIITPEEAEAAYQKDKNTQVSSNIYASERKLRLIFKEPPIFGAMGFYSLRYPCWADNIDTNIVKAAVDEAYEIINKTTDVSGYDFVRYVHTDKEWYERAERFGMGSTLEKFLSKEYYVINYIQACEGIPIIGDQNRPFKELGGGTLGDNAGVRLGLYNRFEIYTDGAGKLMAYEYNKGFEIGDELDRIDVIGIRDVIKSIYKEYKNTYINDPIVFYDIELVYSAAVVKSDNGEMKMCIRPYWMARYLDKVVTYITIDGESGEVVFRY